MATTTSITTTYAGESAGQYIAAALLSADTIDKGLITVKPNIKFKEVIKKAAMDDILKDGTCDFSATSTLTLTERILAPETFQVNLNLCKADFRSDWQAVEMGYSAYDELPSSFADFLIAEVAAKVAAANENNIWQGANATAGEFDGFTVLFAADADVVDVVGTTVTASNVITELGKVVDAIPATLYGKEDLTLYVAPNVARAYVRALGGFAASGLGANGSDNKGTQWFAGQELSFDGVRVAMVSGLPSNDIVAAQTSNLYFGTGLLNDSQEVKILDMGDLDGSQNVRVIMRTTAGIQYGISAEIVYYT
ncbi:MAG: hypothetical protein HOL29_09150 [Euryarchaeota archaeon]|nr:hypothetical protein [Euryarchaeota archaeon]